jgi:hypothetical protein
MELVKGDVLVYLGKPDTSAQKGARAIFDYEDDRFIHVEWVRDGLDEGQMDGGYFKEYFEKEVKSQEESRIFNKNKDMEKEEMIKKIQEIEANSFLEVKKNQQMFGNDSYMAQTSRSEWIGIYTLMEKIGIQTDTSLQAAQDALRIILELERN